MHQPENLKDKVRYVRKEKKTGPSNRNKSSSSTSSSTSVSSSSSNSSSSRPPGPTPRRTLIPKWKQRTQDTHLKLEQSLSSVPPERRPKMVFVGSSMFERWLTTGKEMWAEHFETLNACNAGIGGDSTENVLWRLFEGQLFSRLLAPELVVLLIGTNNLERDSALDIRDGIEAIVRKIRADCGPSCRIVLYGVLPRSEQNLGAKIRDLNDALRIFVQEFRAEEEGGKEGERPAMVEFHDIGNLFKRHEEDLTADPNLLCDHVHFNEKGYRRWLPHLLSIVNRTEVS